MTPLAPSSSIAEPSSSRLPSTSGSVKVAKNPDRPARRRRRNERQARKWRRYRSRPRTCPWPIGRGFRSTLAAPGLPCPRRAGPGRRGSSPAGCAGGRRCGLSRGSVCAVRAGHERGEIVGAQERRWRRGSPGVQAARALEVFGCPQLVVDDAVHVAVVLTEVARRIFQVPEEVRSAVVTAQTPDVAVRVVLEHHVRTPSDLVDVVDLPRGVVQKRHWRGQDEDVVVVDRAAQERAGSLDVVTDLEAEAGDEERLRHLVVGGAEHGVPELAGHHPLGAQHARCSLSGPFVPAGAVVAGGGDRALVGPGGDFEVGTGAGGFLYRADALRLAVHVDAHPAQVSRSAAEIIGVVDADVHVDQAPGGRRDDAQLTAAVTRPQPAVPFGGQTELLIVGGGLRDVWHAHRDGGQAVQSHRTLLSAMWSVLARSTAAACYLTDR